MSHIHFKKHAIHILSFTVMIFMTTVCKAGEALSFAMAGIVEDVKIHMESGGQSTINIGSFSAQSGLASDTYGKRIAIELRAEFEAAGIKVDAASLQTIEGNFSINPESGAIEVNAKVVEKNGKTIQAIRFSGKVAQDVVNTQSNKSGVEFVSVAAGVQTPERVTAIATKTIKDESELLIAAEKTVVLRENESLESILAQVEDVDLTDEAMMIRGNYLVLERLGIGIRFQEINPKEYRDSPNFYGALVPPRSTTAPHFRLNEDKSYIIQMKNFRKDVDLATKILFDGIDTTVFSDSESDRERLLWIVPMQKNVAVYGWFRNTEQSDAFQLVPDVDSVAHQFGVDSKKGTIQLNVFAAWDPVRKDSIPKEFKRLVSRAAVGQGVGIANSVKKIKIETGILLGQLLVQYETESRRD